MSKPAPVYDMPHRREAARWRLAAPAVFLGHDGRQPVTLLDVSQTGAKLVFEQPPASAAGFISWMDFETFGDLIWREGLYIGFAFDRPLPLKWIIETRNRSAHISAEDYDSVLHASREWVGL